MKPELSAWDRLAAAARQATDDRDTKAPYGFATRVAALAMAREGVSTGALFERFSWRALGIAGILALISAASNYSAVASPSIEDDMVTDEIMVTELFDVY